MYFRDGLKTIQKYFKAPEHLLVFLTLLLAEYDRRFASPGETKFKGMSSAGTLAGCLDEVLIIFNVEYVMLGTCTGH